MNSPTTWPLHEQTRAKHELLRCYLNAWFPILARSQRNGRVVFIDGFAGPGYYSGGEPGSPLIAIDTLVRHSDFDNLSSTEFVFIFIESDKRRFESLKRAIELYWQKCADGRPANIGVKCINGEFAAVASRVAAEIASGRMATLAFIDPFGWSGVPMSVIRDLMGSDRCEVIFNYMHDHVNRFVNDQRPNIAHHFTELFATTDAEHFEASELSGEQRKEFLRDLYARQLKDVCGFKYVRHFEMVDPRRNRTVYYLMYGTRHTKGLEVMKEAMWEVDPVGGARFSGSAGDQQMLFAPEPNLQPLRKAILSEFVPKTVSVEMVERFVIEKTDFKATHYKSVLQDLERDKQIRCTSNRRRRLTYPQGTQLEFFASREQEGLFGCA